MSFSGWTRNVVLLLFCFGGASLLFADGTVTGVVRNQTTGRPAAGDTVVLLRLENGMQEEARTSTAANGKFGLPFHQDSVERLVRVIHQGVNYDQKLAGNSAGEIAVYDSVASVQGLTASVGILQIESEGGMLKITEMYSIRNNSNPPVTQRSPKNFEIDVPPDALLDSLQAKRSGAVWVNLQPTPEDAQKEKRYLTDFPLRPGDTLFQFVYRVPQSEGASLDVKLPYPTSRFAVLHSPSLSFQAEPGAYTNPGRVRGMKLEQATSKTLLTEAPPFTVSPADQAAAEPNPARAPALHEPVGEKPESRNRTSIFLLLLVPGALFCAVLIYVARRRRTGAGESRDLEKLKQQLLSLETSRISGAVSSDQYAATKQQIENSIQSALEKQAMGNNQ
jgi:hypothetical protein